MPERVMPPSPYILATYNREKLYDEVWAEPSERVAARYGFSGVMLAKICRELQIPKPPRGYWRKRQTGGLVGRRPKLPALRLMFGEPVVFAGRVAAAIVCRTTSISTPATVQEAACAK